MFSENRVTGRMAGVPVDPEDRFEVIELYQIIEAKVREEELPDMWEAADLFGGEADIEGDLRPQVGPAEAGGPKPPVRDLLGELLDSFKRFKGGD